MTDVGLVLHKLQRLREQVDLTRSRRPENYTPGRTAVPDRSEKSRMCVAERQRRHTPLETVWLARFGSCRCQVRTVPR